MQQPIIQFDRTVTELIQKLPHWLKPLMEGATLIGQPVILILAVAVVSVVSFVRGQQRIAFAAIASIVALGGNTILKHVIHRSRPDTMYVSHMKIHSYSFPSGHAFGSVAFYGLLAYLAYTYLPAPWSKVLVAALVLLILLIGVSRIYLGAHFPSDVVVGWALGAIALLLIIKFIRP